jgi:hypothetical protein
MNSYKFNYDWSSWYFKDWLKLIKKYNPKKILEIGSFEGKSTIFWAERAMPDLIVCIDTWKGSKEHSDINFNIIESNFDFNTSFFKNIQKKKGSSLEELSKLIIEKATFDLIYIDGSHDPRDVISDSILSLQLCNSGGIIIFDDYLWINRMRFGPWHNDTLKEIFPHPKPAIDSFTNLFEKDIKILSCNYQMILEKL